MAHTNYTVTSSEIIAVEGTQVNLTTPSIILTITADPGYTVTHTDFTIGEALPSEVTSAVFSQNGLVVECLVTFDNSFIMPSADVNLPIDIDGAAVLISSYSIAGAYDAFASNGLPVSSTGNAYSATGTINEIVTLFTLSYVADANHEWGIPPNVFDYSSNAFPANYIIERVETLDGSSRLIQVDFTIKYKITATNTTGDYLKFTGKAFEYFIVGALEYYSYTLLGVHSVSTAGVYTQDRSTTVRLLKVFGDPGALVNVDWTINGGGSVNLATGLVIASTGFITLEIDFPTVVIDTTYLITLSGDINAGFVQPNPITVLAKLGINVSIDTIAVSGYTITRTGTWEVEGLEGPVSVDDTINTRLQTTFEITADDGSLIKLLRTPDISDLSNTQSTLNGGTQVLSTNNFQNVAGDGSDTIIIEYYGVVVYFGSNDIVMELDLNGIFNQNPIGVTDSANVLKGSFVDIDVVANDTDGDGHSLRPVILTQPQYGTVALQGNLLRYTHDNSTNYTDVFTYAANDGYINSAATKVNIAVGVEAGDSVSISAGDGIFYIPVVVGEPGGEFTIHFDSGTTADRVELIYEGNIVADTLFICDNLTDANRGAEIILIEAVASLDSFDYVGSGGNGTSYGKTAAWNLKVAGNAVSYADPADVAPTGNVRGVTSNYGGQVGVGDLVYTSIGDVVGTTGLDSADGNASVSYIKASGGESVITVKITGISGTGWSIYQSSMV